MGHWSHRLMVRTTGFQSVNRGSTPRGITPTYEIYRAHQKTLWFTINNFNNTTCYIAQFLLDKIQTYDRNKRLR